MDDINWSLRRISACTTDHGVRARVLSSAALAKSSDIPALEQDKEWEAFINAAPENFEKWIVSIETLPVA